MYRNILILAICNALIMSSTSLTMTSSALVGLALAPQSIYATLPLGLSYVSVMAGLIPISLFMQKYGRKPGFYIGAASGLIGGILAAAGIYSGSFVLFTLAAVFQGVSMASAQFLRFAAAEVADGEYRSRAISWVLVGGLVSAFLGPSIARFTQDIGGLPPFTVAFGSIIVLSALVFAILPLASLSVSGEDMRDNDRRPLSRIVILPGFIVAALCAMIAYGTMNILMVSTPLAMQASELDFDQIAVVIQWHIVGMFAPSFFTGHLIHRFGVLRVMLAGVLALFCSIWAGVSGDSYGHYLAGLVALGIGWNFLFVGGTTLLTEVHRPSEKGMVQGLNDFLVFSVVATTAAISGYLHHQLGWIMLNLVTIPTLVLAASGIVVLWVIRARRLRHAG
ncbi:MAG: MFS transporter [Gammaproteobacteria bacterium]|nr:MFS transporter [Gammaproteobacteria bacterium]MYD76759.1 MFS transporter [Gammaproteobacteria bacterium]MYJ51456.1 MFS transporter [Gammaproteobacteria bacterium]